MHTSPRPGQNFNTGFRYTTFVGNSTNSSSITLTRPADVLDGDLLVACLCHDAATYSYPTSLWTLVATKLVFNADRYPFTVVTRVATANEPTSYTFGYKAGMIVVYRYASLYYAGSVLTVANGVSQLVVPRVAGTKQVVCYAARANGVNYSLGGGTALLTPLSGNRFTLGCAEVVNPTALTITRSKTNNELVGLALGLV